MAQSVALNETDVIAATKLYIDGYQVPKSVIIIDELPETSTGKIQNSVLRQRRDDHYDG